MPGYAERNALDADLPAPRFLWTGETDMACVRAAVGQLVDHAYAHHIQRLMVLGLLNLLLGVNPYAVHRWHMSMFADAIDWVSLPNVLGMSQYGDGGLVGTKPYCASGNYIDRMSDYCRGCRYEPKRAEGEDACPFTTLYWDFLARHKQRFAPNRRMTMQLRNLERKPASELASHPQARGRAEGGDDRRDLGLRRDDRGRTDPQAERPARARRRLRPLLDAAVAAGELQPGARARHRHRATTGSCRWSSASG